jgi:hypothetical protein
MTLLFTSYLCSTPNLLTYSTLEVYLDVHTAAVSFSRRSASGATRGLNDRSPAG